MKTISQIGGMTRQPSQTGSCTVGVWRGNVSEKKDGFVHQFKHLEPGYTDPDNEKDVANEQSEAQASLSPPLSPSVRLWGLASLRL